MTGDTPQKVSKQLAELYQDAPGEHGVVGVRELSADEIDQIERADRLIIGSANAAPWQRSREVIALVLKAVSDLQEADPAGPGEVGRVRAAFGSLREALRDLADKLEEAVGEFGSPDAQTEFGERASQIRESALWGQVAELADADAGSFKLASTGVVVWQRRSDDVIFTPVEVAVAAARAGQDLLIRHYRCLEPALIEAAKQLRKLAVEAPGGTPGIVEITIEGEKPAQMKPRVLALDRVPVALRAARIATRFVGKPAEGEEGANLGDVEATSETDAGPAAIDSGEEVSVPNASPGESESSDEDRSGGEKGSEEASDSDGDDVEASSPLPVEFGPLFSLARNLDTDLEKVWSAALDKTQLDAAVEKQLAAVGTMLSALQRKMAEQDKTLRNAGVDARIMEWPLSEESLAKLELSTDLDVQTRQSSLAQLDSLAAVVETFEALRAPPNVTVSFGEGGESVERFWSAGAFALLKNRLSLLERTTGAHEAAAKGMLREQAGDEAVETDEHAPAETDENGEAEELDEANAEHTKDDAGGAEPVAEETQRTSDAFERLRLGARAWLHGDPEAAVFHVVGAIAVAFGVPSDQLAEKLADKSGGDHPSISTEEAAILSLAAELVTSSLAGSPDLSVATLLAQSALRIAHVLVLGPIPGPSLSTTELAELIESRQPLQPLESEDDGGDT